MALFGRTSVHKSPAPHRTTVDATLIITADDYGLWRSYDAGILEAAAAGAIDAVSVMVLRDPDPTPLIESGVEVGLHLEAPTEAPLEDQLARFEVLFGRPPTHIDGHHHCHARGALVVATARMGRRLSARVRSVSAGHRRLLHSLGVKTPDRLVGRLAESDPAMPAEIEALLAGDRLPPGVTEWMVHPGRPDPASGSSYDRGREEDLELVLRLVYDDRLRAVRREWDASPRRLPE